MNNNNNITYRDILTQDLLQDLLSYDPDTGKLYWRARDRKYFKSDASQYRFNKKYAGNIAGSLSTRGYVLLTIMGYTVSAHRLIIKMVTGDWSQCTDHINGIRDDNRWSNIRSATYSDNNRNQRLHTRNKSGYPGVYWWSRINKAGQDIGYWRAQAVIKVNGKHTRKNLGNFRDLDAAIDAKKQWDEVNGYHKNHGRKIK